MLIEIEHELLFQYDSYIHESFMELRVEPLSFVNQSLRSFYMAVGPPTQVARYVDWNGNFVHNFGVTDYHDRIEIVARSVVMTEPPPMSIDAVRSLPVTSDANPAAQMDFTLFGGPVERSRELEALAADLPVGERAPLGEQLVGIGGFLYERFEYRSGVTDYRTTTQEVLEEGAGVCQDFAHVMLAVLRLREIPCRYVSGYLHVETDDDAPSESHAWIEAYIPEYGWIAFDPTHNCVPNESYVVVARGRHYEDVPPNRGIYRGRASESLRATVRTALGSPKDVASLHEEMGQLDVPVFRGQPPAATAGDDRESEPQQQQQQQQ